MLVAELVEGAVHPVEDVQHSVGPQQEHVVSLGEDAERGRKKESGSSAKICTYIPRRRRATGARGLRALFNTWTRRIFSNAFHCARNWSTLRGDPIGAFESWPERGQDPTTLPGGAPAVALTQHSAHRRAERHLAFTCPPQQPL